MTVVERDDDERERKDLCLGRGRQTGCGRTDGRTDTDAWRSLPLPLSHSGIVLFYLFCYVSLSLSLAVCLSRMDMAWFICGCC